ncbi:MAG: cytochrome c biogenesis protein ResB, partial [Deltaproteobacteria bacterium]|nr:cytochrome c biogenesis protein ResB [Deltaproteobacteria bacterium]
MRFNTLLKNWSCWLYKKFSSLKTSILLLGLLSTFYLLGTIFPQGAKLDDYIKEGGRFTFFVINFDLLDIFTTPGFLLLTLLLFINLGICTYERLLTLLAQKPGDVTFIPTYTITLPPTLTMEEGTGSPSPRCIGGVKPPGAGVEDILTRMGFKKVFSNPEITIMEKGLPYRWLTWSYHLGIFFCFIGFFLTYLFAFEDEITLYPREVKAVSPSAKSRWARIVESGTKGTGFDLQMEGFITEYNQMPTLEYPKDKLSRLAIALGWEGKPLTYTMKEDSFFPKDWKTTLNILEGGKPRLTKTIEVNDPLYYRGFTFYQAAFRQDLRIGVDDGHLVLEIETGRDLIVPGVEGTLRFGTLRVGTLFKKDGGKEEITPFVEVSHI